MAYTDDQLAVMESIIARYPRKRSAIMPLLHYGQSITGFVNNEAIEVIAQLLELETAEVTAVSTFNNQVPPAQAQSANSNSVSLDFIGVTLPLSPLIFAAITFGAGLFIMLIISLICCRKPPSRRKDEEFDGMTATMNTQSQRTFTNSSMR